VALNTAVFHYLQKVTDRFSTSGTEKVQLMEALALPEALLARNLTTPWGVQFSCHIKYISCTPHGVVRFRAKSASGRARVSMS